MLSVTLLDDHVGLRELVVDLSGRELPRVAAVGAELFVHERGAVFERLLGVDHGRQRVVVDLDQLRCVACLAAALRDHDRHTVAHVTRFVHGERPMVRLIRVLGREPRTGQRSLPLVRELLPGECGDDAAVCERAVDVHVGDACVRVGTADDGHPHHAWKAHVVHELGLTRQEGRVFFALDRRADDAADLEFCDRRRHRQTSTPAAVWTARTMLWYPVQRQRLPSSACRISSSVGFGVSSRRLTVAMMNPGVQ